MNTSDTNTKLSESYIINIVIHSVIQLFHLLSSLNRKHYCLDGGCPVGHYGSVQVSLEILLGSYSHWGGKTHSDHFPPVLVVSMQQTQPLSPSVGGGFSITERGCGGKALDKSHDINHL